MKRFHSLLVMAIACLACLTANAARTTIITVTPGSYAELKVYDQNARTYVIYSHLKSGEDNEVTLQDGIGYYIVPGEGHVFGSVVSDDGAYPVGGEAPGLGQYYMIYCDQYLSTKYTVYTNGPTPPAQSGTDFFLTEGSRALLKHYVMWDGDTLIDGLVTDKVLSEGDNYVDLVSTYTYYIVAAEGYELISVADADNVALRLNAPDDVCDVTFASVAGGDASKKYTVTSRSNNGLGGEIKAIKINLAEGSHANIFTTINEGLVLLQTLRDGENFLNTSTDELLYIIPDDGYELEKVTNADGAEVKLDVNPAISKTNYLFITEHLSTEYTVVTRETNAGIEAVESAAEDIPAAYFDLQGRRIERPAAGIYIRVCGSEVSKIIAK